MGHVITFLAGLVCGASLTVGGLALLVWLAIRRLAQGF